MEVFNKYAKPSTMPLHSLSQPAATITSDITLQVAQIRMHRYSGYYVHIGVRSDQDSLRDCYLTTETDMCGPLPIMYIEVAVDT